MKNIFQLNYNLKSRNIIRLFVRTNLNVRLEMIKKHFLDFQKLESFKKDHFYLCSEKEKLSDELRTCENQIEIIQNEIKNLDEKISQYHLLKHKVQHFALN